jgi:CBS domain containing-hemolysin-like protein
MALLLIFALVSIFFSFLCSILEAVLLSVTPTFVNIKKTEGKAYATELEALKQDVDKPLISILTLNTVAHTVGAILVGVQAETAYVQLYGGQSGTLFGVEFSQSMMVGVVSTIMTILILVASEIIPKTIGATYWKQLALFTTKTLGIMVFAMKWTGLLWVLQLFTRLVGKKDLHGSVLSREDFTAMAAIAHEEGAVKESESKVIRNLLGFHEILAKDIMTPRTVMKSAPAEQSLREFYETNRKLQFSRVPVYTDGVDHIVGFVLKDEVLENLVNNNDDTPLSSIQRDISFTSHETPIPQLFETFVTKREHIALVVNEYGGVLGLVTMEDIIETLLGLEILDESDSVENLQQLARKNWETRARQLGILDAES